MDDKKIHSIYKLYFTSSGIEINSKKVKKNSIFIALRGKNFDGNQFASEAILNGAKLAIIDNKKYFTFCKKIVFVKNTLSFLQELAKYHRDKLCYIPIIAITGSNGKTTTKELIKKILSKKYKKVHFTKNNLNNHIGIPLTILSMSKKTEIAVIEIGASQESEIEKMCSIINPDYGYITNFGKSHLKGFKNIKGVIRGKLELYKFLKDKNKIVFVNGDDPIQLSSSTGIKRYIFSEKGIKESDLRIRFFCKKGEIKSILYIKNTKIISSLIGSYNLYNIASAVTIGIYFKVPLYKIKEAIEEYIPNNKRSQIIIKKNIKIIIDCYNANPSSMIEALNFLNNKIQGKKGVILGDMLELGSFSKKEHEKIILFLENSSINTAFLIGKIFFHSSLIYSYKIKKFESKIDFVAWIVKNPIFPNEIDYFLIKGSRKMALESIIHFI
ncbi:UDP-N-acetylmuramoyl-tripeptide--D-alanyl-D-alanine ligase [Blattabacterium cuenoti]|uniref:UDP-N-acetylmuramoyl-tripeptide--D-alanyl-D- alanine ligase n=1 Tax=Blattabacterium cuenoti TaxID=1653831 RepID=UPI00163C62D9|nr:UDP-N-acetylmuramoyl-tripeptide--D-alanyl-D-alanine ligase [Blattabacterium cuenoti]